MITILSLLLLLFGVIVIIVGANLYLTPETFYPDDDYLVNYRNEWEEDSRAAPWYIVAGLLALVVSVSLLLN